MYLFNVNFKKNVYVIIIGVVVLYIFIKNKEYFCFFVELLLFLRLFYKEIRMFFIFGGNV